MIIILNKKVVFKPHCVLIRMCSGVQCSVSGQGVKGCGGGGFGRLFVGCVV